MRNANRLCTAVVVSIATAAPASAAAPYEFDIYRRQGDVIDGVAVGQLQFETDTLTLNNSGHALFLSGHVFGSTLHTGDRVVARVGQSLNGRTLSYIEPASVSMNNGGDVAFIANHHNGSPAVYLNGNPIIEPGTVFGADVVNIVRTDGLELADSGNLAAYARINGVPGNGSSGTYAVVTPTGVAGRAGQTIAGATINHMDWDAENITVNIAADSTGRVAFFASQHATGGGRDTLFTQNQILSPFSIGSTVYGANFRTAALNDHGDYAFVAHENAAVPATTVIVNGGVVARGGQTQDGKQYFVTSISALELNESESVAFFYGIAEPNQTSSNALAVDGEMLLRVGDMVDGYTISDIHPRALGFNDLNETLIAVTLLDGVGGSFEALVRGTPVPEPAAVAPLLLAASSLLLRRRRAPR